ncbi:uncharacterized protein LOC116413187 isoform X2 [Galleria mellonella]|uniref:Uncharacterized protein LOC116413187 isoform X2 n=1 Tax=Galleria mellonella TaxID=7137 RepID=A0ABM3MVB8_GALME|nr:uncharacterized protein LOC116413187 isoform X2 [Galleria mellonella]
MYFYVVAKYKRPRIHVEQPKRLPVPIAINHYKERKPTLIKISESVKSLRNRNYTKHEFTFCNWYKRRKALRDLKKEEKRKREVYLQIARREIEKEVLEQLIQQQRLIEKYVPPPKPIPIVKTKTEKVRSKGKSIIAKPKVNSRYVTVKRYKTT